jgi:hypothetical protein
MVHTAFFLLVAAFVGLAVSACRDIDEPPPLPMFDPDAPLDGGSDATTDSGLAGSLIYTSTNSFAS